MIKMIDYYIIIKCRQQNNMKWNEMKWNEMK